MSVSERSYRWGSPRDLSARLNRRITIEQPVEIADGAGGLMRNWSAVATVWAEIIPQRTGGGEAVFAEQIEAASTHRITLRYRSGITPDMRIQYDGRVFNIRQITNVEQANILLVIEAEEGVAT